MNPTPPGLALDLSNPTKAGDDFARLAVLPVCAVLTTPMSSDDAARFMSAVIAGIAGGTAGRLGWPNAVVILDAVLTFARECEQAEGETRH